jgi:DNA invertase Pin-like site-specific DNA recombinase
LRAALYGRVSTTDKGQDPELQLRPLREYCGARSLELAGEYVDYTSGSKDRRPELDRLLDAARKRQVDCIVVWKLDRFGRSLKHLITALDELNGLGVGFISYSENIDLSTASGRLMFHIIASMAEFERELIRERVKAGIANARAKGKRHGRKPLAPVVIRKVIEAFEESPTSSVRTLAEIATVSPASAGRILKDYKAGLYDRDGFRYERPLVSV